MKNICIKKYLNHLVDPSFEGVNRLFVFFLNEDVMIDSKNFFNQPKNTDIKILEKLLLFKEMIA